MAQVNLSRWRPHLEAIERTGVSVAHYAREHGLSRHSLYVARRLRLQSQEAGAKQGYSTAREPTSAFMPVRIIETRPSQVVARLPNGVELRFGLEDMSVLQWLAGLPCSA